MTSLASIYEKLLTSTRLTDFGGFLGDQVIGRLCKIYKCDKHLVSCGVGITWVKESSHLKSTAMTDTPGRHFSRTNQSPLHCDFIRAMLDYELWENNYYNSIWRTVCLSSLIRCSRHLLEGKKWSFLCLTYCLSYINNRYNYD